MYFWQNPLYFFNGLLGSLNGLKWIFCSKQTLSKIQFYIGIHLDQIQILNFENMIPPTIHAESGKVLNVPSILRVTVLMFFNVEYLKGDVFSL